MQISPIILFGLALSVFALSFLPDKYRPAWIHRPNPWQILIGLVAVIAAAVIVMTPEFYALGILGDSAFFDLLVLAISLQLNMIGSRVWRCIVIGFAPIKRFLKWRLYATQGVLAFTCAAVVSTVQKVMHRISS